MTSTVARDRLEAAVSHQRAGRFREAVAILQELLRAAPRDADLMQRLGVALAQLGQPAQGAPLMAASLELQPGRPSVLLNLARALLALGRPEAALQCCDRAVALDSAAAGNYRAGAYRLRGAALTMLGRRDEALANLGQAVRLAPNDAEALTELGVALEAGERTHDALNCFERALELDQNQSLALQHLAKLTAAMGDYTRALGYVDRALALQPQLAALHSNRGNFLTRLDRLGEALASYATALAIDPANLNTLHNRAMTLTLLGRHAEALRDFDELLAHGGERPSHLLARGTALLELGRPAEAAEPLERAAALLPQDREVHAQHGSALLRLARYAEALESFDRALGIGPERAEILNNRGVALEALGRPQAALQDFIRAAVIDGIAAATHVNIGVLSARLGNDAQAAASFDRALSIDRDDPAARLELAFLYLAQGDFRRGWPLYEARFRVPALAVPPREFGVPRWTGEAPIAGKILLVHAEQGLGDTIQFCRYLPLLAERGATVMFEVMAQLKALMGTLPGAIQLIGRGELLPRCDYHCPLMSLPLAFGTELASIPQRLPYLAADPVRASHWAARLQQLPGLRVGLAWQGNAQVERLTWARGRSPPLAAFEPLTAIPGLSLVSLQQGEGLQQLRAAPFRDRIFFPGEEAGADAFLDTAAIMASLDLIISSDTSVAHLAAALARPTWVALSAAPDWRWLRERSDSPWYPTMRLFRQPGRSNRWDALVAALAGSVEALIAERAH
jgi:tetratricopeptide (TPR) repeat protein